jgi:hypothetical protein
MDVEGELCMVNGVIHLTIWHDKGKSVFAFLNGVFVPVDGASVGALADLRDDIPVGQP